MYLWASAKPLALDFASTIVFVAAFAILHNPTLAIALGIAAGIGEIGWQLIRRKPVSAMEFMSLLLVVALGSASLITHDPRFVMVKPSIAYAAICAVMLKPGWQARYAPPIAFDYVPRGRFVVWGYVWAALMAVSAVGNLVLVALVDLKTWSLVLSVWGIGSKATLFAIEYLFIRLEARAVHRRRAAQPLAAPA